MAYTRQGENSNKPQGETARGSRRRDQVSSLLPQHSSGRLETLQQTIGNQGVLRRMEAGLRISDVNDPSEREADRVAQAVMTSQTGTSHPPAVVASPAAAAQRKCAACEEEEYAANEISVQRRVDPNIRNIAHEGQKGVTKVLQCQNQPLPQATRDYFEPRFGHDFSQVRIHTDSQANASAKSIGALAYSVGNDIVFASGRFAPEHQAGKELLAHELTHVVQNGRRQNAITAPLIGPNNDVWEQQATRAASGLSGGTRHILSTGAPTVIRRTRDPNIGATLDRIKAIPLVYTNEGSIREIAKAVIATGVDIKDPDNLNPILAAIVEHFGEQPGRAIVSQFLAGLERAKTRLAAQSGAGPNKTSASEGGPTGQVSTLRLSKPPGHPAASRVDAAIELTRRALIYATSTPPDNPKALEILGKVQKFLRPLVDDLNISKHFHGPSRMMAQLIAVDGVSAVKSIEGQIRSGLNASAGGRSGGMWDYYFDQLQMSHDYLLVLADEGGPKQRANLEEGVNQAFTASLAVIGTVTLVAVGAGLVIEAAGSATLMAAGGRITGLVLQNPVLAEKLALVAVGTVLRIVTAGGIKEYTDQLFTPEGALWAAHDIIDLYCSVPSSGGGPSQNIRVPAEIENIEPNGTITVRVKPSNVITTGQAANDNATFPRVPSALQGGTAANDVSPSNVIPLQRPQPTPIAVAAGQDFSSTDVNQPATGITSLESQIVASAKRGGGGKPVPRTTTPPTMTTRSTVGSGSSRGASNTPKRGTNITIPGTMTEAVFKDSMKTESGMYVYELVDAEGNHLNWGTARDPYSRFNKYVEKGLGGARMRVYPPQPRYQALGEETSGIRSELEQGRGGLNVRTETREEMRQGAEWTEILETPKVPDQPLITIRR